MKFPIDVRVATKKREVAELDEKIGYLMSQRATREEELAELYKEANNTIADYYQYRSTLDEFQRACWALGSNEP